MALKVINPALWTDYSVYLNACRMRRNTLEYEMANVISQEEADKLISFTQAFQKEVNDYAKTLMANLQ